MNFLVRVLLSPNAIWIYICVIYFIVYSVRACCMYMVDQQDIEQFKQLMVRQLSQLPNSEASDREITQRKDQLLAPKWKMSIHGIGGVTYCEEFNMQTVSVQRRDLIQISIRSSDMFGEWQGEGFIGIYAGGALFSMMKHYDDKQKVGQTGKWSHLQYQGRLNEDGKITGGWWYRRFESNPEYSGRFEMEKVQQMYMHDHAE